MFITRLEKPNIDLSARASVRALRTACIWFIIPFLLQSFALADESVESVMQRVRDAIQYDAIQSLEHGFVVEGHGETQGLDAKFTLYNGVDARFRMDVDCALGNKAGFDGKKGWRVDATGMPASLEFNDLEVTQLNQWLISGYWLSDACPIEFTLDDASSEETIVLNALMPDATTESAFYIDRKSALPVKQTWIVRGQEYYLELDDYRRVCGFSFPHRLNYVEGMDGLDIEVDLVRKADASDAAGFQAITEHPHDTKFDDSFSGPVQCTRTMSNHFLAKASLDGQDAGLFFLDTGAGMNVVDKAFADKLELAKIGHVTAVGVGGEVQVPFRKGHVLKSGPQEMLDPLFVEIEIAPIGRMIGCEVGGILGYDFFMRTLVEMDMQGESVKFFKPGAWDDREAPWQELIFDGSIPSIRCRLEGDLEGLFHLDTGSGDTVELHSEFVKKHKLLEGRDVVKGMAGGVGGFITTYRGKIDWFELGGHRFKEPPVSFAETEEGVFSDEASAGNIGNGFMSKFIILLDYPNKRIAFLKREK